MASECVSKGTYKVNVNEKKEPAMRKVEYRVF